ncbi:WbqC family protein [Alkalinema sp. FACHB-956]|uniref:WbqC family protein n=1 Tax=Alkalinema sp. FACHB-956 TaxID=2692768 RepID=UPI001682B931|nr:WbqC family protein [Alkalinema sp. FACHB-956]MBD2327192.1 WbqC family protein [Alkalinema sp. FACHB-956]
MQPTYLPWAGYFNLMTQADIFIILDDVQFERRSWQSRNRILLNGQECWLTVPVHSQYGVESISTIQLDNGQKWRKKHIQTISQAYSKAPYADCLIGLTEILLNESFKLLVDLNVQIITWIANQLNLNPKIIRASEVGVSGKRSQHLYNLCEACQCDEYLSPIGSQEYLIADRVFEASSTRLIFQDYNPQPYPQLKTAHFISHLSIVDVIANLGWERASEYVLTGKTMNP